MDGGRIDYTLGFQADTAAIKAAADEMMRCNATWDQSPGAVNKLDAAEKKQAKTTLDLTKNKVDLKKALQLVATGNYEAGVASNFLMGRMAGLVGVGMYLIQQTKQGIASLMESIGTPVWEGFVGIVQNQRKAFQEAAIAAGLFNREIERAELGRDSRSEAAGRLQEVLQARLRGEDALLERRKANEIQAVQDSGYREEQKQSLIAGIEERYARQRVERERAAAVTQLAVEQLRGQLDSNELGALGSMREVLLANRVRLGTKESVDAKEAGTQRRLDQERARLQEIDDQIAKNEAQTWFPWNAATNLAEWKYLKQQREGTSGNVARLQSELADMEKKNPARRRAIAENEQALGWIEGDMRTLAGSVGTQQRGARTQELVTLLGLNASAAGAGMKQLEPEKFSKLIYEEMKRLNANLEKPFTRQ